MAKKAVNYTLDEQLVSVIAREFGPEDELAVSGMQSFSFVACVLAQRIYAPKMRVLADAGGKWPLTNHLYFPYAPEMPPDEAVEKYCNMDDVFEFMLSGRFNNIMQPAQIDMYGNMNISCFGDWHKPTRPLVGSRGVPDNTTNGSRIYYTVPKHEKRSFMEKIDFVCGVGWTKERREGKIKFGGVTKVFSNLGVFDFDQEKTGRMRLLSYHTGVTIDQVQENTSFELIIPKNCKETDPPTEEELMYMREVCDPGGVRRMDLLPKPDQAKLMQDLTVGTTYEMIYGK